MICAPCARRLSRLRPAARAAWRYDVHSSALVWSDERIDLCPPCSRVYAIVLNVRTQFLMGERPGPDYAALYAEFRALFPKWVGFRRKSLTAAQRAAARRPAGPPGLDEVLDGD